MPCAGEDDDATARRAHRAGAVEICLRPASGPLLAGIMGELAPSLVTDVHEIAALDRVSEWPWSLLATLLIRAQRLRPATLAPRAAAADWDFRPCDFTWLWRS